LITFKLFRIPVAIRLSFLAMVLLLALIGRNEPARVAAWVGIVFFSILIHELGHALTARSMGATVAIELNGLGGLTRWGIAGEEFGPGRRALVAGAGSAVGVVFGGLVWLVASQFGPYSPFVAFVINNLIWVNLFWGLLNWAPIRPLDGGHLLQSLLQKVAPDRADSIARVIFTITAAAALFWAIQARLLFVAVLAGWMLLIELSPRGRPQERPPLPDLSYDQPEETDEQDAVEGGGSDH
jgi:Zn-dependent protease